MSTLHSICLYYSQVIQYHSMSSDSSKNVAATWQHSLWYHSPHLLHWIISPSSMLRHWQYTFIATALHDLHFLVTCRPLNAFKTPLSMLCTKSLLIVVWSYLFSHGSLPLTMLRAFAMANRPQSLVPVWAWMLMCLYRERINDNTVSKSFLY